MKKIVLTITAFMVTLFAVAQSPNLLNYQGVARNAAGNVLPAQPIGLRLSILSGGPAGTPVYTETRNVTTNAFGLFNVQVGSPGAITQTGTIAGINWTAFGTGSGTKYLQVEIDPVGGTNYFNVGSTQLVSVPYALYAAAAAPVGPAGGDLTGTYPNPTIAFPLIKTFNFPATQLIGMTNSSTTGTLGAITGSSASTDANATAIQGTISSTSPGGFSAAVRGINNGTGGLGIGVWGSQAGSGWGVYGTSTGNGIGVFGSGTTGVGVQGNSSSSIGVQGISTSNFGVRGESNSGIAVLGVVAGNANGQSGRFENFYAGNTVPTVGIRNVNGVTSALDAINEGTGPAGTFTVNNTASTADALRAVTNGIGASWAIRATSTGTNGAGLFISNNPTATNNNLQSNTNGLGRAGLFNSTNAASTANGVDINVAGTGFALRAASSNAAPKALLTAGGVQLTGIGEANNLILKSDAVGNANWATPASAGIVTGTGTLNFVPKWTPNGTNLGNSQIFDDGSGVAIGTASFFTPTKLLVQDAGGSFFAVWNNFGPFAGTRLVGGFNSTGGLGPQVRFGGAGAGFIDIGQNSAGDFTIEGNDNQRLVVQNTGNVGIGTSTPQHQLTVGGNSADAQGVVVRGIGNGPANWKGGAAFGNASATVIMGELNGIAQIGGHNNNLSAWAPLAINAAPGNNVGIGTQTPTYALDVNHNGFTGVRSKSLANFSVVDIDAANGDAALRYQVAGTTRWNVRNEPGTNNYQIIRNNNLPANVTINNSNGYVGIVQTAPSYQLDVLHAGGVSGASGIRSKSTSDFSVVDIDAQNGDEALRFLNNGNFDWHMGGGLFGGLNFLDMKTAGNRMLIANTTGNVGISSNAVIPATSRLQVDESGAQTTIAANNTGTSPAGVFTVNNAASTADALRAVTNGVGASWAIRATSTGTNGAGLFISNNATATNNNLQSNTNGLGRAGLFNSTNAASASNGVDINVAGTGYALRLNSTNGAPRALQTIGAVQHTGIGEAAGRVLTSDAAGNATWQDNPSQSAGISLFGISGGGQAIPNATVTTINTWSAVLNEDGGSNYNSGTGEYTIPKTGVYQINAGLAWPNFASVDNRLQIYVNGSFSTEFLRSSVAGASYFSLNANYAKRYNAGDKITIAALQFSGATQTTLGNLGVNNLSIQFLHN